jgi:di/tricarboxylate transporter
MVNTALSRSRIGAELGLTVLAIGRSGQTILTPEPITVINSGDTLLVLGRWDRVEKLNAWGLNVSHEKGTSQREFAVDLTEVIIPPRSGMIGKTLRDIQFRSKFGLTSVALWREGRSYRTDVGSTPLAVGDALLMVGAAARMKALAQDSDYLVLQSSHQFQPPNPHKARWALLIMLVVLAASIVEVLPLPQIMLAGAAAVVLTGCLNMDEAYRAVEWRVVFLIAGMIPLSLAMVNTGLGARLGTLVTSSFGGGGAVGLILGFWALATAITQIVAGQVTPLMIGPVAIASAVTMGVNPQAMAVAVAIGASTAFLTPLSHAVNILMMGPGGYTFGDFTRVGIGMTLVTLIGLVIGLALFWGIR